MKATIPFQDVKLPEDFQIPRRRLVPLQFKKELKHIVLDAADLEDNGSLSHPQALIHCKGGK